MTGDDAASFQRVTRSYSPTTFLSCSREPAPSGCNVVRLPPANAMVICDIAHQQGARLTFEREPESSKSQAPSTKNNSNLQLPKAVFERLPSEDWITKVGCLAEFGAWF